MNSSAIGIIGLATMGRNLTLNFLDSGHSVSVWNLEREATEALAAEGREQLTATYDLAELVASLERPRKVLLMIKAGAPVDETLNVLQPLLDPADIVIDGGNTNFNDTRRRAAAANFEYVGLGVSGGEIGARTGASLMFGGERSAWDECAPYLTSIAAESSSGACCHYVGPDGAGHFAKMVHNGIEYGMMQVLAEVFDVMQQSGLPLRDIASVFTDWQHGELQSYLVDLTSTVLRKEANGQSLVPRILDVAEQKGTGRWTVQNALELGIPIPTIAAAVDARSLSGLVGLRHAGGVSAPDNSNAPGTDSLKHATWLAFAASFAQGMQLLQAGSAAYDWNINLGDVARTWTGGCIIRARMIDSLIEVYAEHPALESPLLDTAFAARVFGRVDDLRNVVTTANGCAIPVPALSATLAWMDTINAERLPQNLIQAQRDAFGAHTYRTIDAPDDPVHTDWFN